MAESEERVARLETVLLELETNPERIDGNLDAMFRELHSLKGNSSTLLSMLPNDPTLRELHALAPFKTLVHDIESFVATHRDSRQPFSPTEIEALFRALDHIRKLLLSISKDESSALDINAVIRSLSAEPEEAPPKKPAAPSTLLSADVRAFLNTAEQCLVAFTKVAELAEEQRDESQLKKFRRTAKTFQKACAKFVFPKMEEVAERVLVLAENNTLPAEATLRPSLEKIADLIEFLKSGGEREKDSTPPEETTRLTAEPNAAKAEAPPPAQPPPDKETKRESAAPVYVRVPQTRVDRMMNLVGELLVSKHSFRALGEELNRDYELSVVSGKVLQAGSIVGRIADDLRAEMMEIRMVPLDLLFSRFPRMIRDLSKSTGKPMKLAIVGSDVRMDKTIVEQLNDPLVHLLRNCGDHGIESPEKRAAAGKPAEGIVTVSAMRQGQRVIVTVEDDGQGLNIERLRSKALEKSIVHEAELERMTPKEIQELIFRPGFSTATEVTDISGRGVGMDAVRQALSEIGAGLNLESKPGHGTRFLLSIPLTLAVSQGLMIEAAGAHFILPLEAVEEIVKAPRSSIRHFGPHQHFFEHRGEVLPVTSLRNTLAYDQGTAADTESCRLLVIDTVNQRYALEVDRVLHEMEMLVKPLEGKLHQIPGISGTTISGDGSIIIVLNPAELFDEIAA
jgi:two-component system chemotaxis sensor kinase CheA